MTQGDLISLLEQTCRRSLKLGLQMNFAALASIELDRVLVMRSRLAVSYARGSDWRRFTTRLATMTCTSSPRWFNVAVRIFTRP